MGEFRTNLEFAGELPAVNLIAQRLGERTKLRIKYEVFESPPERSKTPEELQIFGSSPNLNWKEYHFELTADGEMFSDYVECRINDGELVVKSIIDPLNRCPNYVHFGMIASLVDLGGKPKNWNGRELPDYAKGTWAEWKKMNGGFRPPLWKTLLFGTLCIGSIFAAILGALLSLPAMAFRILKIYPQVSGQLGEPPPNLLTRIRMWCWAIVFSAVPLVFLGLIVFLVYRMIRR
jgi:hypothetical protein